MYSISPLLSGSLGCPMTMTNEARPQQKAIVGIETCTREAGGERNIMVSAQHKNLIGYWSDLIMKQPAAVCCHPTGLLPSQPVCCHHSWSVAMTVCLLPSQLVCCHHSWSVVMTVCLLPSQLVCFHHSYSAAITADLLPSQPVCCPHSQYVAITVGLLPSQLVCCHHS